MDPRPTVAPSQSQIRNSITQNCPALAFGPASRIETGLYNGGAGGPDRRKYRQSIPGQTFAIFHFGTGVKLGLDLYALAVDSTVGPEVFEFDPRMERSYRLRLRSQLARARMGSQFCRMATT